MFKYMQTTSLLLFWCFFLSITWGNIYFYIYARKKNKSKDKNEGTIIPAIILAPLSLIIFYKFFTINLLFPIQYFVSFDRIFIASFIPSIVLMFASGLILNTNHHIRSEYNFWKKKPFVLFEHSYGKNTIQSLRKLIILKSMVEAWEQSLPWLFGELIIVEAIFNAPGLALDAWHLAKIRDFYGLLEATVSLFLLYGLCTLLASYLSKWLGRKLDSYA